MIAVIAVMIFSSFVLLALGLETDPAQRVIQQRVYEEIAEEDDRPRPGWLKSLAPIARLNQQLLRGRRRANRAGESFIVGKMTITATEFLVIKQLCAGLAVMLFLSFEQFHGRSIFWVVIAAVVGFLLPELWLRHQIRARRHSIASDLPEVIELLTLCVDAGADFMNAVQRVVREYRPCPLRSELALVLQEVSVGKRRREAFKSLANRVKVPEVNSFSRSIIHADRMGTGMAQALRIMSEDSRLRRYHQAERFAQQAPLKMLIPLIFVMFSVLIVVAGPVLLQFFRGELWPKF